MVFNHAEDVLEDAGFQLSGIMFNIVIIGTVNLLFTFVAMATVDKLGRRALMLLGAPGLAGVDLVLGGRHYTQTTGPFFIRREAGGIIPTSSSAA
jgi:SP family sugar porter-like MFS transporter